MTKDNFHLKITLILSLLILLNYTLLAFSVSQFLLKINFILFLITLVIFYAKNLSDNLFLKIFLVIILFISLGTPVFEWDPRSNYLFHAKRIFFDNSIFSIADNYASFSHNEYPTLAPAFASSLALLFGYWNEVFPKTSFLFMFAPPLILTYIFFKNTSYIIFLSIVFFIIGKYLFNGWPDGLVAVYFCLSTFLMYILFLSQNDFYKKKIIIYFITFCFFVSLTLIKNEGLALLIILFIVTLFFKLLKNEIRRDMLKIFLLSLSFIPIILWKFFCYKNGIGVNDYINSNTLNYFLPRIYDFENYKLIGYFLLLNEKLLLCLTFFLLSFWITKDKDIFNFVSAIFLIYLFVLFVVFLSTPYDFYFQLNSTAARVVKSLSFLLAFFGLYNLRNYIKN